MNAHTPGPARRPYTDAEYRAMTPYVVELQNRADGRWIIAGRYQTESQAKRAARYGWPSRVRRDAAIAKAKGAQP